MSKHYIVGVVVNPKLKKPVLVTYDGEINLWSMDRGGTRIGVGYYEGYDDPAAHATGLPRVHTPSGVTIKGKGYGTTLYTGLCVGAHLNHEGDLSLDSDVDGDGISSDPNSRSPSASKWWSMAVRLRLAQDVDDEFTQEDIEFDSYDLECSHSEGEVHVDYARGDLTTRVQANAYYWEDADDADLVVAALEGISIPEEALIETERKGHTQAGLSRAAQSHGQIVYMMDPAGYRNIWKALAEHDDASYVNRDALLALDMRDMEPHAVNLLSTIAVVDGVKDEDISVMRLRAERNLDPETPVRQLRLQFAENPSNEQQIMSALEETKELRASLDWKRLSALP